MILRIITLNDRSQAPRKDTLYDSIQNLRKHKLIRNNRKEESPGDVEAGGRKMGQEGGRVGGKDYKWAHKETSGVT